MKKEEKKEPVPQNPEEQKETKTVVEIVQIEGWTPKTEIGKDVRNGNIVNIETVLAQGKL